MNSQSGQKGQKQLREEVKTSSRGKLLLFRFIFIILHTSDARFFWFATKLSVTQSLMIVYFYNVIPVQSKDGILLVKSNNEVTI